MKPSRPLSLLGTILLAALLLNSQGACSPEGDEIIGPTVSPDSVPGFRLSQQAFIPRSTFQMALADLDADGDLDAVLSNMHWPSRVLLNDGQGYFQQTSQLLEGGLHGIAIGDLDLDGTPDLIFGKNGEDLASPIYLNRGQGLFEKSSSLLDDATHSAVGIGLHDIENDGDLDAIVHYIDPIRINILYLNDGTGSFSRTGTSYPAYSSFGDLNDDGFVDMIARQMGVGLTVHLNDQAGNLVQTGAVPFPEVGYGDGLFEDIDNDGDTDFIYTAGESDDFPAGVLLNDGAGGMTGGGQTLASVSLGRLCTGDLDGDGWVDLIITDMQSQPQIWMNDGQGRLVDSGVRLAGPNSIKSCQIEDLDGDGDEDIFIADYSAGSNVVWFNELIGGRGE